MMAIAFDRVSDQEVARSKRYDFRSLYIVFVTLGPVSTIFDFIYFGLFYRIWLEVLQTNWFIASLITELLLMELFAPCCPSKRLAGRRLAVVLIFALALVITQVLPMIPWTAELFGFTRPSTAHLMLIVSLGSALSHHLRAG